MDLVDYSQFPVLATETIVGQPVHFSLRLPPAIVLGHSSSTPVRSPDNNYNDSVNCNNLVFTIPCPRKVSNKTSINALLIIDSTVHTGNRKTPYRQGPPPLLATILRENCVNIHIDNL